MDTVVVLADRVLELSKQLLIVTRRLRVVEEELAKMQTYPSMDCDWVPPVIEVVKSDVDDDVDVNKWDLFG